MLIGVKSCLTSRCALPRSSGDSTPPASPPRQPGSQRRSRAGRSAERAADLFANERRHPGRCLPPRYLPTCRRRREPEQAVHRGASSGSTRAAGDFATPWVPPEARRASVVEEDLLVPTMLFCGY
jgi:hypothetical protein